MEKLGAYAAAAGCKLGAGWSARRRLRTVGVRAGTYDIYYVAPDGEVRRSATFEGEPWISTSADDSAMTHVVLLA